MISVIVTEPEYLKASSVFRTAAGFDCIPAPADEAGLAAKIRATGARFAIVGVNRYRAELYDAIPSGGVIARFGVGHDGIDKVLATCKGILCCNTPGVLDESVAECTIGLMLACARHLACCSASCRGGAWQPAVGIELSGKTLAVIGCGNIGRKVARSAKLGFGMRVVGFSRREPENASVVDTFTGDFAAAVAGADFVSVHIPDNASTRDFINRNRLLQMRSSAILINTSRGGVVDEDAVYDAVVSGAIAGAGLDVFKHEPYLPGQSGKDLRTLDRVVMTPHIGSSTREACERMAKAALANIERARLGNTQDMNLLIA
jgi:phosphoglycerate dehydrogenase-like enzyme